MKSRTLSLITIFCFTLSTACSQKKMENSKVEASGTDEISKPKKSKPHQYGGWYCPDNLNGFPPVHIADWKNVPVIDGRLPSKAETQTEASLIFVDLKKYPNAKTLDMELPQMARFYNHSTQRNEDIIVIQALNIQNDSIVGFRYLNGGNGSARLEEIEFLSNNEIEMIPESRFVTHSVTINAPQEEIWQIITNSTNTKKIQPAFDKHFKLNSDWREKKNVNYHYPNAGIPTAMFANKLFGCYYVQNDYERLNYTEKFLLLEDEKTKVTELKIVCGPYLDDFTAQETVLLNWAIKVKELAEL